MTTIDEDPQEKAFVVVICNEENNLIEIARRFKITDRGIRIGNTKNADIPVCLDRLEPCLIQIVFKDPNWCVVDLASFSGVAVNGVSAQKVQIFDGDLIQIGKFVFEFCSAHGAKFSFYKQNEKARQEDVLTHAYNRVYLYSVLQWEINRHAQQQASRRNKKGIPSTPMSLIMFDIDHFGSFNKRFDHQVGDEVLKGVVERVKSRVRSTDVVARYGGEEFIVYLPDTKLVLSP